ncbi:MAG: ABA4-like family protein [Alteraurantiacibacter sp.]
MSWDTLFGIANGWAALMWLVLIALPRTPFAMSAVFYAGVGLLCTAYALLMALLLGGAVDPGSTGEGAQASFFSIAGVRALFGSDGGVTIGWIHYLALDLFAGVWIAKDADAKRFSRLVQAPVLLLTFFAGPAGLLVWLLIREKRARAAAGPRRVNR